MADPASDAVARNRWAVIQVARLGGVALVVAGVLIVNRALAAPEWAGYAMVAIGLVDVFLIPAWLARKWRTPKA